MLTQQQQRLDGARHRHHLDDAVVLAEREQIGRREIDRRVLSLAGNRSREDKSLVALRVVELVGEAEIPAVPEDADNLAEEGDDGVPPHERLDLWRDEDPGVFGEGVSQEFEVAGLDRHSIAVLSLPRACAGGGTLRGLHDIFHGHLLLFGSLC